MYQYRLPVAGGKTQENPTHIVGSNLEWWKHLKPLAMNNALIYYLVFDAASTTQVAFDFS